MKFPSTISFSKKIEKGSASKTYPGGNQKKKRSTHPEINLEILNYVMEELMKDVQDEDDLAIVFSYNLL